MNNLLRQKWGAKTEGGRGETEADAESETKSGPTEDGPDHELSLDLVFELLKNQRRRQLIQFLLDHDGRISLGELAEHIAADEYDTTVEALNSKQRKRVYVGLYQCHLPKMDDLGVLSFDKDRGMVESEPELAELATYLDVEETTDRPRYPYLAIALGGWLLFVVSLLAGGAYGLTPTVVVSLVLVGVTGGTLFEQL